MKRAWDWGLTALALTALVWGIVNLEGATGGLDVRTLSAGATPVTVYQAQDAAPAPAVVIAHGFAGSQQLMQPFAVSLARAGYLAVTFDFLGHGRHPHPLGGSITAETGATVRLVEQVAEVIAFAKTLSGSDGRVALLGHSMASDIIVRAAQQDPTIAATIAVAMFAPTVDTTSPRNLLVVVGEWEPRLQEEALRVAAMVAPGTAEAGVTYGDPQGGTGRRVVFADNVEHVAVLYSGDSLEAARDWLNLVFDRSATPSVDTRGMAIVATLLGIVLLARPLARLLPQLSSEPLGADLGWRGLIWRALIPMILTPLLLRLVPFQVLPVLVADYLVAHFALYGLLTVLTLAWPPPGHLPRRPFSGGLLLAALPAAVAVGAYSVLALGLPLDRYVTAYMPTGDRTLYLGLMLAGTLPYFLADEWLTRGGRYRIGRYAFTKLCFLVSLGLATALDIERLFFLLLIAPLIAVCFVVYGLFAGWAYRRTGQPLVGALANAVAFAWAIAVTFPIVSG